MDSYAIIVLVILIFKLLIAYTHGRGLSEIEKLVNSIDVMQAEQMIQKMQKQDPLKAKRISESIQVGPIRC